MYTELNCAFGLKEGTPQAVIDILIFMTARGKEPPLPDHPLFKTERWTFMLQSDSEYFSGDTHSVVRFDDVCCEWHVTIRSNVKNYDGEIEHFFDWITPHIDAFDGDFIGYSRYEETEVPTLIYHPNRFFKPSVPESIADE